MINFFQKDKKTDFTPEALRTRVSNLEKKLEEMTQELKALQQHMKSAVCKVAVVRFDAFKETGGDQSFSIALLDEHHNGIVVTSYYGRDMNRVYGKPIKGGKSEYSLSKEEMEAIEKAVAD